MAILRESKIREMSVKERERKLQELKTELLTIRSKAKTSAIESAGRLKELRRTIARIITISNEEGHSL
jgi:large subunit ribosomal protein L29